MPLSRSRSPIEPWVRMAVFCTLLIAWLLLHSEAWLIFLFSIVPGIPLDPAREGPGLVGRILFRYLVLAPKQA